MIYLYVAGYLFSGAMAIGLLSHYDFDIVWFPIAFLCFLFGPVAVILILGFMFGRSMGGTE